MELPNNPAGAEHKPMRCRQCLYILDGLTTHRCPECGTTFDPNDEGTTYPGAMRQLRSRRQFVALFFLFVALPLELLAGMLAYETLGEVVSGIIIFFVFIANGVGLLLMLLRLNRVALVVFMIVAILVIPWQAYLGVRLVMLDSEARSLVAHLEHAKRQTGAYPPDLKGYTFQSNANAPYFYSYSADPKYGGYIFYWYVGTRSTSHWHSPETGWGYYPD